MNSWGIFKLVYGVPVLREKNFLLNETKLFQLTTLDVLSYVALGEPEYKDVYYKNILHIWTNFKTHMHPALKIIHFSEARWTLFGQIFISFENKLWWFSYQIFTKSVPWQKTETVNVSCVDVIVSPHYQVFLNFNQALIY